MGINTWAVSVLRYTGGDLDWNQDELQAQGRKKQEVDEDKQHYIQEQVQQDFAQHEVRVEQD